MKISMTPTAIHGLKTTGKRYDAIDLANTGLLVRVGKDGSKHYAFRSSIKTGVSGRSPQCRLTYGRVAIGAGGKPDKGQLAEAKKWALGLKALTDAGVDPKEERATEAAIPTLADTWSLYRQSRRSMQKAVTSQEADERNWRLHIAPVFATSKVTDITTPRLVRFYDDRKSRGRNANQILALVSVLMSTAVRQGAIPTNPCREVQREKESSVDWERLNNSNERASLIRLAYEDSEDAGLIVELALKTGSRKQEILKARWERITPLDAGGASWVIPDTKSGRTHRTKIPPLLYERLKNWQGRDGLMRLSGWLFPSPVNPENPREDTRAFFTRIREQLGKPRLRFHDLRHDFGTQLAIAGLSTTDIMAAMGHSNISTTMRYINLAEAEKASMATGIRERAIEDAKADLGHTGSAL